VYRSHGALVLLSYCDIAWWVGTFESLRPYIQAKPEKGLIGDREVAGRGHQSLGTHWLSDAGCKICRLLCSCCSRRRYNLIVITARAAQRVESQNDRKTGRTTETRRINTLRTMACRLVAAVVLQYEGFVFFHRTLLGYRWWISIRHLHCTLDVHTHTRTHKFAYTRWRHNHLTLLIRRRVHHAQQ